MKLNTVILNRFRPFAFLLTLMLPAASYADVTTVPMVSPTAGLNDAANRAGWEKALVLRGFGAAGSPETDFRVQHDGGSLWVAVDCTEPRPSGPRALRRGPEADLTVDDAVEVALGLPGGADRDISMGGYEGAMAGKTAPMAQLYEFVANAAGSTARRYDEAALPTPRFDARVTRTAGGWRAVLRIPFAGIGLKNAAGQEIYANFVRYRDDGNIAWRGMNMWGGYRPFPVALLRLAASPEEGARTVAEDEAVPASAAQERIEGRAEVVDLPPLSYHPLSNTVLAATTLARGEKAILWAEGARAESRSGDTGLIHVGLELPGRPAPGGVIEATLETHDSTGKLKLSEKRSFTVAGAPEWAGTTAGSEYSRDKVPAPWKAPELRGQTVKLSHAAVIFGDNALPASIVGHDGDILAAPSSIKLWKGKTLMPVRWTRPVFSKLGVRQIIMASGRAGAKTIEVRTELDYDGFMAVQVRLRGGGAGPDRIQFVYPLKTQYASYIARRSVQKVLPVDAAGYSGPGGDRFWLGSEAGGLAVSTDLPFYQAENRQNEIAVRQKGAVRELTLTPVDNRGKLGDGKVLQFYLQPTPVRSPSQTRREDYDLWFEQWSDYQGYPDLKKMPQVKEHVEKAHSAGKQQLLYFNQLLAEDAPGFKENREEFIALPERAWYQRSYDPGRGVPCYVSCIRGPYGDLLLDGIRRLANEGGIDGIYMDGTSVVWDCDTPSHLACDIHRRPVWGSPGPTPILGARDFLKRLRGIFDGKGKPFTLVSHTGGDLDINTLGLVDFFVEGEQLSRYLPQFRIPRAQFAIGYSGAPWGYRTLFHDYWLNGRGLNWSLAYTLLFNTDDYGSVSGRVLKPFSGPGASFHPFWKDGQGRLAKSSAGRTSVSWYRNNEETLLVASNLSFVPDEIELKTGGLAPGDDTWIDILTGRTYTAHSGLLRVALEPWRAVALRPRSQVGEKPTLLKYDDPRVSSSGHIYLPLSHSVSGSEPDPSAPLIPELNAMEPAGWKGNEGSGVQRRDEPAPAGSPARLVLSSQAGGAEARAWLERSAISGDAEIRLRLKSENRPVVRIEFGAVDVTLSNGRWDIAAPFDGWNDQPVNQLDWPAGKEVELVISISNNELTILLDGQPVADGMMLDIRSRTPRPLQIVTWSNSSLEIGLSSLTAQPKLSPETGAAHPVSP